MSEADAAKRIVDASKPLAESGITVFEALATVARHERAIVTEPMVKGELSTRLSLLLDPPFLRECRPCNSTHTYEMTFRLAALQAGLELDPDTSPPVLRRTPGVEPALFAHTGEPVEPRLDVVRSCLRFFGPARPRDVAAYLDAPVRTVKEHWPADAIVVALPDLDGEAPREPRYVLQADLPDVASAPGQSAGVVRLVGSFDAHLRLRDRETLVDDDSRRKALWPTLGRPGAILLDGEVAGTWRPRTKGKRLTLAIEPWQHLDPSTESAVREQAERYARFRGLQLADVS